MINSTFKQQLENLKPVLEQSRNPDSDFCKFLELKENRADKEVIEAFSQSLLAVLNRGILVDAQNGQVIERKRAKLPKNSLFFNSEPKVSSKKGTTRFAYFLELLERFFKRDSASLLAFLNQPQNKDIKSVFHTKMQSLCEVHKRFLQSGLGVEDTMSLPPEKEAKKDTTSSIRPWMVEYLEGDEEVDLTQSIKPWMVEYLEGDEEIDITQSIKPWMVENSDSDEDVDVKQSWGQKGALGLEDTMILDSNVSPESEEGEDPTKSLIMQWFDDSEEEDPTKSLIMQWLDDRVEEDPTKSLIMRGSDGSAEKGWLDKTAIKILDPYGSSANNSNVDSTPPINHSKNPGEDPLSGTKGKEEEDDLPPLKGALEQEVCFVMTEAIEKDDIKQVMQIVREKGLLNVAEYLKKDLSLSYSILKMINNESKKIESQEQLREYGNLVGHILLNPEMINSKYLNIFTSVALRCLVEADDPVVIQGRKNILTAVAKLNNNLLYLLSTVTIDGKSSSLGDFLNNTSDYQLFSDFVLTPNLLPDYTHDLMLKFLWSKTIAIQLFENVDFNDLKGKSWEELNLVEKIAFKSKEKHLQKAAAHAFDLDGSSQILWDGMPVTEEPIKLEGQTGYHGLLQMKHNLAAFQQSPQMSVSPAFLRAANKIMGIAYDKEKENQTTSHHPQDDVARYIFKLPKHCTTAMIGDKYYFKNNRGRRGYEKRSDVPAGIEIFEIPEERRADMIKYLDKIKNKQLSYADFEEIPQKFGCKKVNTIYTKEQSVGNCTFVSIKLLLLSLCYYQHLEDTVYNHELSLALATRDYIDFVNFSRQDVLDRYKRESLSPNAEFLERLEAIQLQQVKKQIQFLDAMEDEDPEKALEDLNQTILVVPNALQPRYMLERSRMSSFTDRQLEPQMPQSSVSPRSAIKVLNS